MTTDDDLARAGTVLAEALLRHTAARRMEWTALPLGPGECFTGRVRGVTFILLRRGIRPELLVHTSAYLLSVSHCRALGPLWDRVRVLSRARSDADALAYIRGAALIIASDETEQKKSNEGTR